ncbi:MAG: TetR/AcrR family transcriptional regulator [Actinobacteria bacterium]|nr:TetR/AcrR family transcriptional regulator [Actinomycetota bacterium]
MPKIVDHDERRALIVEALWRVIARDGAHEVSVRHVAAEAGMPKSSIGHYVGTMPQLLGLAVDQLVQSNIDYVLSLDLLDLDADKATEVLFTLVPVSERRRHMSGVWLLLVSQAGADAEISDVLYGLNVSVSEGLHDVLVGMRQQGLVDASRDIGVEVRRLHALIDGLAIQCLTDPHLRSEADVRAILRHEVARLADPDPVTQRTIAASGR